MTTIEEMANEIRNKRNEIKQQEEDFINKQAEKYLSTLLEEFEIAFKDYLPLLEEAGITYKAELQDRRYKFKGSYIEFKKDDKILRMDFNDKNSYRYEYVDYDNSGIRRGNSVYGNWNQEDFIIFIDEGLLNKKELSCYNAIDKDNDIINK